MENAARIIDERKTEMIGGKIVMLSSPYANHSIVSGNIFAAFHSFLRGKKCRAFEGNIDVALSPTERYIPDVTVICDLDKIKGNTCYGPPDLVVEVLSRSTGRYDKGHKKRMYEKLGVKEYWIVDPRNRTVEIYHIQDGIQELDGYYISPADLEEIDEKHRDEFSTEFQCAIFPELTIRLEDVFADMLPE